MDVKKFERKLKQAIKISLQICYSCYCMTKTIGDKCGKCLARKVFHCEYCDWRGPEKVLKEHLKENHTISKEEIESLIFGGAG